MEPNQQRAFNFFFQTDLTQQQIADLLDVNRRTLHRWAKEGGWRRARYAASHAPSMLIEQYYEQLGQINLKIAQRTDQPYPTKEESETIRRITMTIKHMRNGKNTASESIDVFQAFMEKLRKKHMPLLAEILPLMTKHIKDLSEKGQFLNYSQLNYEEAAFDKEFEQWCTANPEPPQDGETPSPTPEPLPPTSPSGSSTTNQDISDHSEKDNAQLAPEKLPACEGGDDQKASASLIRGGGAPAGQVTQDGTSNGTSAHPESALKTTIDSNVIQNDNTELSTKKTENPRDIQPPKLKGRRVQMRTVEYRFTPNDRLFYQRQ